MGRLSNYIDKLKTIDEQLQTNVLLQIVNRHQSQLIDLNQLQLMTGRNSRGEELGQYRNAVYALFKNRLNPLPGLGVWDLRLSGDLYRGMYVEGDSFPVNINSSDSKADKFRDAGPFGFEQKSKDEIVQEVKPEIQEFYRSVFQL
jgi:hypothetical protein